MGESDAGVVFQGEGDPLEATAVVLETVRLVAARRNGLPFRVNTLGLCDEDALKLLLECEVLERLDLRSRVRSRPSTSHFDLAFDLERLDQGDRRRETRIACVSVFLPAATPSKYDELLAPRRARGGRGFRDVCSFVARLTEAGVNVECTAVARPDVNVAEIETRVRSLGARSFRTRSWVE